LSFPETVDMCKTLDKSYSENGMHPTFIIEDVAYQKALPQQLETDGIRNVKTTRPGNADKRSRLMLTSTMLRDAKILFPREGAEELIQQIVYFGVEKHDDLADAFINLAQSITEDPPRVPRFYHM
jgi:phage terminase large subunit-like protein